MTLGLAVILRTPGIPTCAECKKWWYEPNRWTIVERPRGTPLERPMGAVLPCRKCPKIPRGAIPCPENAIELTDKSRRAYWYYRQCLADATNLLPRDALVVQNNALIRGVEEASQVDRFGRDTLTMIAGLAASMGDSGSIRVR